MEIFCTTEIGNPTTAGVKLVIMKNITSCSGDLKSYTFLVQALILLCALQTAGNNLTICKNNIPIAESKARGWVALLNDNFELAGTYMKSQNLTLKLVYQDSAHNTVPKLSYAYYKYA
jgi:hypothetical protein